MYGNLLDYTLHDVKSRRQVECHIRCRHVSCKNGCCQKNIKIDFKLEAVEYAEMTSNKKAAKLNLGLLCVDADLINVRSLITAGGSIYCTNKCRGHLFGDLW